MPSVDLTRFERSLTAVPTRRDKVANARLIAEYIEEERRVATPEERPTGIWSRVRAMLTNRSPALAFSITAAALIFAVATAFLFINNRQKQAEIAALQDSQTRRVELEREIDALRQREAELEKAAETERDTAADIVEESERGNTRIAELEAELKKIDKPPPPESGPIIASIVLLAGTPRGGQRTRSRLRSQHAR